MKINRGFSIEQVVTGFFYDDFGNLIWRTQGSLSQQCEYDDENRLLKAWG